MASRLVSVIAGAMVALLIAGPIAAVLARAGQMPGLSDGDWQAIRFTVTQATLSALISVALAIPTARALARRRFPGRGLLVTILGAPFILPVIVAVLGLIAVFGQNGLLNSGLAALGLPKLSIYGLHGVVLAHVFFNLPLATRMILQGWMSIPAERFRLCETLDLPPVQVHRVLERPMLRRTAPSAAAVIFVICLSSFAVALTLGGGPKATTLELAIYQALRFDFDIARATMLALLQLGLAMFAGLIALRLTTPPSFGAGLDRFPVRRTQDPLWLRAQDTLCILAVALFLLTPLGLVVWNGLGALLTLDGNVAAAAINSLWVALVSTLLCLVWALPLANRTGEWVALAGIALSPLVLGIGLFLLVRPYVSPFAIALPVTATINALASLPFAVRILRPEAEAVRADFGRLSASLNLSPWVWATRVFLPRLRRPIGFAAGLTAALSMGDLGVIALFADPDRTTLPLQIYRLMGAYRMDQAASAALILLTLSLGLFWLFDKGGRVRASV